MMQDQYQRQLIYSSSLNIAYIDLIYGIGLGVCVCVFYYFDGCVWDTLFLS